MIVGPVELSTRGIAAAVVLVTVVLTLGETLTTAGRQAAGAIGSLAGFLFAIAIAFIAGRVTWIVVDRVVRGLRGQ